MYQIQQEKQLSKLHTFGVDAQSAYFAEPTTVEELVRSFEFKEQHSLPHLIMGEGSNILFRDDFPGLIIHPLFTGLEVIEDSTEEVLVHVGAGENWDAFVEFAVQKGWYGIENLSLIPGSVGAAPVQNIGAYGVEAKDVVERVIVFDSHTGKISNYTNAQCEFAYRESVFKHAEKGRLVVIAVEFRLKKHSDLILDYGNVRDRFEAQPHQNLEGLRQTIISIRNSKLPDPEETGNAGSFFKNPVISIDQFESLKRSWEGIPSYPAGRESVKVPAAWFIDQCGWKGYRDGDTGTWPTQPLVLVNWGAGSGESIFRLSESIQKSVRDRFDIALEREVLVLPPPVL